MVWPLDIDTGSFSFRSDLHSSHALEGGTPHWGEHILDLFFEIYFSFLVHSLRSFGILTGFGMYLSKADWVLPDLSDPWVVYLCCT